MELKLFFLFRIFFFRETIVFNAVHSEPAVLSTT